MKHLARLGALVALVVGIGVVSACERGPNPEEQVSQALKNANIEDVRVDYDRDARVVHLKGTVPSEAEKRRAEEVAATAVGTTGKVVNELAIEGMEAKADNMDGEIRDRLDKMIDGDPLLKERDINFSVNNGAVTVTGEVRTAEEKEKVGQIVHATPGVKDMANSLEVKPEAGRGTKRPYK